MVERDLRYLDQASDKLIVTHLFRPPDQRIFGLHNDACRLLRRAGATSTNGVILTDDLRHLVSSTGVLIGQRIIAYVASTDELTSASFRGILASLRAREITVIYPDQVDRELHYPSPLKIVDAIICRDRKRKYNDKRLPMRSYEDALESLEVVTDLIAIGRYLHDNGFNTAPTDGFVAAQCRKGFLITSSDTPKHLIERDKLAFVHLYDEGSDTVWWSGLHPPSSETSCAALIFERFSEVRVVAHFHCKAITYSPFMERNRTARYVPYGTPEEAQLEADQLAVSYPLAILRGHGEIAVGTSATALTSAIERARDFASH